MRFKAPTGECHDPGDETEHGYADSLIIPAIELALHGPPKWQEEAVRRHAELMFGRKRLR